MKKITEQAMFMEFQRDEATGMLVYGKLSKIIRDEENAKILETISKDEASHYETFKNVTGCDVKPRRFTVFFTVLAARVLGITFALKLLEKGEEKAQKHYLSAIGNHPELKKTLEDEERHEMELLNMLEEELLDYVGSMVLGLNDALVELTGALAGLTFAFRDTRLIALSGLITGIAASLSMASSEFLSHRADGQGGRAAKAALYTGLAYIITVIILVLPYLLLANYTLALFLTLAAAILIILIFNFYISIAKDVSFKKHFFEMAGLSLGVAALSFGIGILVREFLGVDV